MAAGPVSCIFERVCGALIRHMQGALIIIGPLRSEWFSRDLPDFEGDSTSLLQPVSGACFL